MSEKVWITGMGAICAVGKNISKCMNSLYQGVQPQQLPYFYPEYHDLVPACTVDPAWLPGWTRHNSAVDTFAFCWHATQEALAMAKISDFGEIRAGICIGTTAGSALHFLEGYKALRNNETPSPQADISDYFNSNLAVGMATKLNIAGPLLTVTNACTSGTDAIGIGAQWIKQGLCDVVIAGGSDALSLVPYTGFQRLMIYSSKPCAPFDQQRDGLNLGEGAGILLLESFEHAKRRNAKPICEVAGYGSASDAYHITAPHPEGRGLKEAILLALRQAGIEKDALGFINAHGTATRENDKVESMVLSSNLPGVPIWASKGNTGHCLGAAGTIEAIFTAKALICGEVPPTTGCRFPEEAVKKTLTLQTTRVEKDYALSVSLGFGGVNSAIVLKKTFN